MTAWIMDLDDTIAHTTRDMGGEASRVSKLTAVEGLEEFLNECHRRGHSCLVVTVGSWSLQSEKLSRLAVQVPMYVIFPTAQAYFAKREFLNQFATKRNLDRKKVVHIGDRLDRDIEIGKSLGFWTIRMRTPGGKYSLDEPTSQKEVPDFTVHNFFELIELPFFAEN